MVLRLVCTAGAVAAILFVGAVSTAFAAASLTPLGDLPGGSFYSVASGASADGSIVVGASYSASGYEAYRWTSDGGMVGLGDLPGGLSFSVASVISGDGSVVVGGTQSNDFLHQAFLWTASGGNHSQPAIRLPLSRAPRPTQSKPATEHFSRPRGTP